MSSAGAAGPWRRVTIAAVLAVAAWSAWRIVTLALADYHAGTDPQRAVDWRPDHPQALLRLSELRLKEGRLDEAAALARRALAANPLDGRGFRVLGNVAGLKSDRPTQQAMMDLAARHAPRDVATRAWAAHIALEHHDAASAVRHYDRMIRVAPDKWRDVFPVLMGLGSIDEGRAALVHVLADRPPWRSAFMRDATEKMPDWSDLLAMCTALRAQGGLEADESGRFLDRLVRERRWDEAFVAWAGGLPPRQLGDLAAPMDGDFENFRAASGPFDWQITRGQGSAASIQGLADGSGHALKVEFVGQRRGFRDVRQLLLLPAGQGYRLQWRSRFDDLETPRGLRWTISCAGAREATLLVTPPVAGSRPWHSDSAEFAVPEDCPAQWLTLELEARIAAETQARGTAWFDDVRVISPQSVGDPGGGS